MSSYSQLISRAENAISLANQGKSKLTQEILDLGGMSSAKVRHFLNNICSHYGTNYLEVGTYAGSTFVSALFRNYHAISQAIAIDNYSQFGGYETFQTVTQQHLVHGSFDFFKEDFRKITPAEIGRIDVYFYDGAHEHQDHVDAILHFRQAFADQLILIIDDWLEPQVKSGTLEAIEKLKGSFALRHQWELPSRGNGDTEQWWNGVFVGILSKE